MSEPKLMSTSDHSLFKDTEIRQQLGPSRHLIASMRKHGFLSAYPILASRDDDGTLKLEGGRARLAAAKELGIPVYYMIASNYTNEV